MGESNTLQHPLFTGQFFWSKALKGRREMGDSVKRDAKSIFGERGPHKKQLRERTKFHGREEIRGHGKISVFLRIKSICHNFSFPLSSFQLFGHKLKIALFSNYKANTCWLSKYKLWVVRNHLQSLYTAVAGLQFWYIVFYPFFYAHVLMCKNIIIKHEIGTHPVL